MLTTHARNFTVRRLRFLRALSQMCLVQYTLIFDKQYEYAKKYVNMAKHRQFDKTAKSCLNSKRS